MPDNCATCFFFRTFSVLKDGTARAIGVCARNAPRSGSDIGQSSTLWPEIPDPLRWWCGEFLTNYPNTVQEALNAALAQIAAAAAQTAITTGDAKLTLKTTADAGYVMMDDGTIGSATSGASTRANSDCQALFTLLWTNIDDTGAPVVTGRGASAAADWAANKKLTLTKQLGRSIAIAGAGSGLTSRLIGRADGAETKSIGIGNMPAHDHGVSSSGFPIDPQTGGGGGGSPAGGDRGNTSEIVGSGIPLDVMNPRSYWNVMLKL